MLITHKLSRLFIKVSKQNHNAHQDSWWEIIPSVILKTKCVMHRKYNLKRTNSNKHKRSLQTPDMKLNNNLMSKTTRKPTIHEPREVYKFKKSS